MNWSELNWPITETNKGKIGFRWLKQPTNRTNQKSECEFYTGFVLYQRASWTCMWMKVRNLSVIYLPVVSISKLTPDLCCINLHLGLACGRSSPYSRKLRWFCGIYPRAANSCHLRWIKEANGDLDQRADWLKPNKSRILVIYGNSLVFVGGIWNFLVSLVFISTSPIIPISLR